MLGKTSSAFRRADGRGVFPFLRWRQPRVINRDPRPFKGHRGAAHRWRTAFDALVHAGQRVRVEYCAGKDCFATREIVLPASTEGSS